MSLTLVLLAAGLGRRFGGLKQLASVGDAGTTLLDYTLFDARRAGFARAFFVIRPEMEREFHAQLGRRYERAFEIRYVHQRLDHLPERAPVPPERTRPWGTGHAVWCALEQLDGTFGVANADDFYGRESFVQLHAALTADPARDVTTHSLIAFPLAATLSPVGAVSRAVCTLTPDGWLEHIVERTGIERDGGVIRTRDATSAARVLADDALVSMNLWGFTPAFGAPLQAALSTFVRRHGASTEAEFHLPAAVNDALKSGAARVRVTRSAERWCGLTHPSDLPAAAALLRTLTAAGLYPERLWS